MGTAPLRRPFEILAGHARHLPNCLDPSMPLLADAAFAPTGQALPYASRRDHRPPGLRGEPTQEQVTTVRTAPEPAGSL